MNYHRRRNLYLQIEIERTREIKLRAQRICILLVLAGILVFMLSACANLQGDGTKWKATIVFTDLDGLDISALGAKADKINHSVIFTAAAEALEKAFAKYLSYKGIVFTAGQYFNQQGLKISSSERVQLEELRNAKSIAEMKEATKRLQLMTPEASMP